MLASVNKNAAAKTVQSLATAPTSLLKHPYLGEKLEIFNPRYVRRILVGHYELRLANDSRPTGAEKLSGDDRYRVRQGNYRIVYSIQDNELTVGLSRSDTEEKSIGTFDQIKA